MYLATHTHDRMLISIKYLSVLIMTKRKQGVNIAQPTFGAVNIGQLDLIHRR